MMCKIKYPSIYVSLEEADENAFAIMGRVQKALRRAKVPQNEIDEFMKECKSGDYDHLLQTVIETVNTGWDEDEE